MKKNKKTLYLLLSLTILIWSFLIYKVFFSNKDKYDSNAVTKKIQIDPKLENESKLPPLLLNYTDPFLKIASVVKKKNNKPKINKKKRIRNQISWPKIKYSGMIQNKNTNEIRINIAINNKYYIMKENDIVRDIILLNIYSDSIILSKNKILKTFKKRK